MAQQLVWEGEVDATSIIYVRRSRVDVEDKQGAPVQRPRFRFSEPLPDTRQDVRIEVLQGRGSVQITQQPRLDNNYTLAVSIEDRQSGRSFYSLAFHWQNAAGFSGGGARGSGVDRLTWSGSVDGEAVIECRDNRCDPQSTSGAPVRRDRFQFSRPLPKRAVRVSFESTSGRGEIRLLEQPSDSNGYAAKVLIRDNQGGAGDYAFALGWQRPSRNEPEPLYARRGLVWFGRVDGLIRVVVHGQSTVTELMSGSAPTSERANFDRPLPASGTQNATIRKLRGRGRVEILEYPSDRNGHRLVFEVDDSEGGADDYEIEISW